MPQTSPHCISPEPPAPSDRPANFASYANSKHSTNAELYSPDTPEASPASRSGPSATSRKRPHGRPRLQESDRKYSEKRREQIRNAQRTYRMKKESATEYYRKRTRFLTATIAEIETLFAEFYETSIGLSVRDGNPEVMQIFSFLGSRIGSCIKQSQNFLQVGPNQSLNEFELQYALEAHDAEKGGNGGSVGGVGGAASRILDITAPHVSQTSNSALAPRQPQSEDDKSPYWWTPTPTARHITALRQQIPQRGLPDSADSHVDNAVLANLSHTWYTAGDALGAQPVDMTVFGRVTGAAPHQPHCGPERTINDAIVQRVSHHARTIASYAPPEAHEVDGKRMAGVADMADIAQSQPQSQSQSQSQSHSQLNQPSGPYATAPPIPATPFRTFNPHQCIGSTAPVFTTNSTAAYSIETIANEAPNMPKYLVGLPVVKSITSIVDPHPPPEAELLQTTTELLANPPPTPLFCEWSIAEKVFRLASKRVLELFVRGETQKLDELFPPTFNAPFFIPKIQNVLRLPISIAGSQWLGKIEDDSEFPGWVSLINFEKMMSEKGGAREFDVDRLIDELLGRLKVVGGLPRIQIGVALQLLQETRVK